MVGCVGSLGKFSPNLNMLLTLILYLHIRYHHTSSLILIQHAAETYLLFNIHLNIGVVVRQIFRIFFSYSTKLFSSSSFSINFYHLSHLFSVYLGPLRLSFRNIFFYISRISQPPNVIEPLLGKVLEDREAALELRVHTLLDTLDRLTQHAERRQQTASDLIEDLKRANRYEGRNG